MSHLDYSSIFKRMILIGQNVKRCMCMGSVANWFFPVSNKDQFLFRYAGDVIFFQCVCYVRQLAWGVFRFRTSELWSTYFIFVSVLIAQQGLKTQLFAGFVMIVVSPTQTYLAHLNKRI